MNSKDYARFNNKSTGEGTVLSLKPIIMNGLQSKIAVARN